MTVAWTFGAASELLLCRKCTTLQIMEENMEGRKFDC